MQHYRVSGSASVIYKKCKAQNIWSSLAGTEKKQLGDGERKGGGK
jgi:hypothetical protein